MDENQNDQKYKTISSQQDTRNPTTNKKVIFYTPVQQRVKNVYFTPDKKRQKQSKNNKKANHNKSTHPKSFSHSLNQLKQQKDEWIRTSRYDQAQFTNQILKQAMNLKSKSKLKKLIKSHKQQKKSITKAHKNQMANFQRVWTNYFQGLKQKQKIAIIQFKKSQKRDISFVKDNLIKKCQSLKVNTHQLISLQKKQKFLRKQQNFQELITIAKQKERIKKKLLQQQQKQINKFAEVEQQSLRIYHTKKYNSLLCRIQQHKNDHLKLYQRQDRRLRQKYRNVMRRLQHQQKVELNLLLQDIKLDPII